MANQKNRSEQINGGGMSMGGMGGGGGMHLGGAGSPPLAIGNGGTWGGITTWPGPSTSPWPPQNGGGAPQAMTGGPWAPGLAASPLSAAGLSGPLSGPMSAGSSLSAAGGPLSGHLSGQLSGAAPHSISGILGKINKEINRK